MRYYSWRPISLMGRKWILMESNFSSCLECAIAPAIFNLIYAALVVRQHQFDNYMLVKQHSILSSIIASQTRTSRFQVIARLKIFVAVAVQVAFRKVITLLMITKKTHFTERGIIKWFSQNKSNKHLARCVPSLQALSTRQQKCKKCFFFCSLFSGRLRANCF